MQKYIVHFTGCKAGTRDFTVHTVQIECEGPRKIKEAVERAGYVQCSGFKYDLVKTQSIELG